MNKYVKEFLRRGLMFSGFGPIVFGIIVLCISYFDSVAVHSARNIFMGIVTTYTIAFVQAGVTVFNQIEHWSVPKSLLCHFGTLYVTYSLCYIFNSWIPFKAEVLVTFTVIFAVVFFAVWGIVYLCVRNTSKKINEKLR
jgi:hypothetical protein